MEVLCEQCQTEYDFDDALVSQRGTTVKCTNCGHQFRIYRPRTGADAPERWDARCVDGRELVFASLRDLQRAISRAEVGRDDTLSRDGLTARKLGAIAELEPFFPDGPELATVPRMNMRPPPEFMHAPLGLGVAPTVASPATEHPTSLPQVRGAVREDHGFDETTVPRLASARHEEPAEARRLLADEPGVQSGAPSRQVSPPAPAVRARFAATEAPARVARSPDSILIRDSSPRGSLASIPGEARPSFMDDITDSRFVSTGRPRRSAAARVVVGAVLLGALSIFGLTVGRQCLVRGTIPGGAWVPADAKVGELLEAGENQLRSGDVDTAKASFDKASVLAENNPQVLRQLARLANIRADVPWLKLRVLDAHNTDVRELTGLELKSRAKQALETSGVAYAAASNDSGTVRTRIDAFRLAGDLASARGLVPKLGAAASEPESAYVLAALDMSESRPNWAAVIDRLTVAVQGEGDLGRARGALVYALAQSGQLDAARAALAPLASRAHPHPLLAELKAHVAGIAPDAVGHAAGEASGVLDPLALPVAAAKTGDAPTPSDLAGGKRPIPGSHQELLKRAHEARNAGHLSRAERLYRTVLMRHSGDAEALTGLGDIARELGDKSASIDHYEQAARQSPSYFPALMGLADARWESGDRAGAATLYERVVQSTGGQGTYGQRARQRIAEATAESKPRPDTASAPRHTSTSQAPPAPTVAGSDGAVPPPGVDTSDLPGWSP